MTVFGFNCETGLLLKELFKCNKRYLKVHSCKEVQCLIEHFSVFTRYVFTTYLLPMHNNQVRNPGHKVGVLDQSEAIKMNLNSTGNHAIPVAASLIDAHAGALGMLAIK